MAKAPRSIVAAGVAAASIWDVVGEVARLVDLAPGDSPRAFRPKIHEREHFRQLDERYRFAALSGGEFTFVVLPIEQLLKPIIERGRQPEFAPVARNIEFKQDLAHEIAVTERVERGGATIQFSNASLAVFKALY